MKLNGLKPQLFVEPFAGGASVALRLLQAGLVERIALGERDPMVASFWKVVFTDTQWLIDSVRSTPVTLDKWDEYRKCQGGTDRDRALACLFLNRTSFSGILASNAGPIGGRAQKSAYKINCRFNPDTIVRRISQAAEMASKVVFVECASWADTIAKAEALGYAEAAVFYYFDPPFYAKAKRLYRFHFDESAHRQLHDRIISLVSPWLLSYDPAEAIIGMYSRNGRGPKRVELLYSAAPSGSLVEARELIVTNLKRLPARKRLWRSGKQSGPAGRACEARRT